MSGLVSRRLIPSLNNSYQKGTWDKGDKTQTRVIEDKKDPQGYRIAQGNLSDFRG